MLVQMIEKMSSMPEHTWQGKGPVLERSRGADVAGVSPGLVPEQMVPGVSPVP